MDFINENLKDLIAFIILLICLLALIFKENKTDNLSQTLGYIITGCLGFLFRGGTT